MRGFIIINPTSNLLSTHQKVESLIKSFKSLNVVLDIYKSSELNLSYKDGFYNMNKIKDYDFCIFLDNDRYLAHAINLKLPMFNNASSILYCDDKMLTYQILNGHNIKTPLTIPCPLNYSSSDDNIFLEHVKSALTYPFVAKKVYGSLGKDVVLIHNEKELLDFYKTFKNYPHIYQEYIGYEFGTDYRLITINKKVVAQMERKNKNDFRSNIAQGGKGRQIALPEAFIKLAEKVSEILDLDYAGIDILKGKDGEPILNEVNSNAFFSEIEKVTRIDISLLLAKHIINKINTK